MLLKSIELSNFLSFGDAAGEIEMHPLNVVIGPNGSGKSNLINAIDLIRSAPKDLLTPVRDGGGVHDWLWTGAKKGGEGKFPTAAIDAVFTNVRGVDLRYVLRFTEVGPRFEILDERVENRLASVGHARASILSQRKNPDRCPELTELRTSLSEIRLYRNGRCAVPPLPQERDVANEFLAEDAKNLGLVLNRLCREPAAKRRILEALGALYDGIDDYYVQIEGGRVQVFFQEGKFAIPATRLSDGTLRYLSLLAILCHPNPPPLICIEEPELGLHPDVLPTLGALLKGASTRTQLIVTTHSDVLVDAMSDTPESVVVAEKLERGTSLTRLDGEKLKPWLAKYRLGQLWTRGDIGGIRW